MTGLKKWRVDTRKLCVLQTGNPAGPGASKILPAVPDRAENSAPQAAIPRPREQSRDGATMALEEAAMRGQKPQIAETGRITGSMAAITVR